MEVLYRQRVQAVFRKIDQALAHLDPDQVDCEESQGSLVIALADRSKCILSLQPSVEQLWVALASQGRAYHFIFDDHSQQWWDDRGQKLELFQMLERYLLEVSGLVIRF